MITVLSTYDWQSAKESFKKSGIQNIIKAERSDFLKSSISENLTRPYKSVGHLLSGFHRLFEPNKQKEFDSLINDINGIYEKMNKNKSTSKTQLLRLKGKINKCIKLAKSSKDQDAIDHANRMLEDFNKDFSGYLRK